MTRYFLDSNALVKLYKKEPGSSYIQRIIAVPENTMIVAGIARVEVISALARSWREGAFALSLVHEYRSLFADFMVKSCVVIEVNPEIYGLAQDLALAYPLRAYDAVQLASAVTANNVLVADSPATGLTFVIADNRLLEIASAVQLATDNPSVNTSVNI